MGRERGVVSHTFFLFAEKSTSVPTAGICRFCGAPGATGLLSAGATCADCRVRHPSRIDLVIPVAHGFKSIVAVQIIRAPEFV